MQLTDISAAGVTGYINTAYRHGNSELHIVLVANDGNVRFLVNHAKAPVLNLVTISLSGGSYNFTYAPYASTINHWLRVNPRPSPIQKITSIGLNGPENKRHITFNCGGADDAEKIKNISAIYRATDPQDSALLPVLNGIRANFGQMESSFQIVNGSEIVKIPPQSSHTDIPVNPEKLLDDARQESLEKYAAFKQTLDKRLQPGFDIIERNVASKRIPAFYYINLPPETGPIADAAGSRKLIEARRNGLLKKADTLPHILEKNIVIGSDGNDEFADRTRHMGAYYWLGAGDDLLNIEAHTNVIDPGSGNDTINNIGGRSLGNLIVFDSNWGQDILKTQCFRHSLEIKEIKRWGSSGLDKSQYQDRLLFSDNVHPSSLEWIEPYTLKDHSTGSTLTFTEKPCFDFVFLNKGKPKEFDWKVFYDRQ